MNILEKANEIVNQRSEEKERQYGPFSQSMAKTVRAFNALTGHSLSTEDAFLFMAVHKLARQANAHKEDNLLDACAYLGGLNNHIESEKNNSE